MWRGNTNERRKIAIVGDIIGSLGILVEISAANCKNWEVARTSSD